jgi:taurine dioxygenase
MGAEIQNVDLRHLDAATFAELSDALHHHKMVFIRQQNLSFEDQEQLTPIRQASMVIPMFNGS